MKKSESNRAHLYVMLFLSAAIYCGCGIVSVMPSGSNVAPDVYHAAPMAAPPYYVNSEYFSGVVGYFDVVLDSVQERDSQIIASSKEQQDWHSYAVSKYLKDALPEINEYFRSALEDVSLIERLPQNSHSIIDWRDYYSNDDRDIYLLDLPKVHFGDPAIIIENSNSLTFQYDNKAHNWLSVIQGKSMWFSRFNQVYDDIGLDYYLDIRVGLIEVAPTEILERNGLLVIRGSEHRIGTNLVLENDGRASHELPINVIAFKGLLYNSAGEVVNAGVEGFIPMYPNTGEFNQDLKQSLTTDHIVNSMIQGEDTMHLITNTRHLNEFNEYPWRVALDNLLQRLKPVENKIL